MDKDEKNRKPEAYDADAWVAFQCNNLIKYHDEKMADEICNKETYQNLLKTTLVNLNEEEQKQIGGDAEDKYFLPSKAPKDSGTQKLLHMTYVFQIFVFMQIFNQCNARLLTGSFNIFEGMSRNWLFIAVALSTFVIQMTMVEVGGKITKTYPLELWRNGICLIFGSGELIWGILIKFLPI